MIDTARRRFCLAASLATLRIGPAWAGPSETLRLGLMPVYNTRALVTRYEPLRAHLSALLGRQVRVETAPDFKRYLADILAGNFDIAVAAAHFARIAQLDAGWHPIVQFEPDHDTLLIRRVNEDGLPITDLLGRKIAVVDRLAITVMGALHYLEKQGLRADQDYAVLEYRTHSSVVSSLISNVCAIAVTTSHGLHQLPSDMRDRITVYRSVSDIPAFVVIASPRYATALTNKLRRGLMQFQHEPEGHAFLALSSYTGLHVADEEAMRRADTYLKETRRMVAIP